MTSFGTLGGNSSGAAAINGADQIAGSSATPSQYSHAFLLKNGVMKDLGTLGTNTSSFAHGINNNGDVVGYSGAEPFLYSNGVLESLGMLPGGAPGGEAYGINDTGQIVGYGISTATQFDPPHAFIYESGTMYDLNNLQVTTPTMDLIYAYGINNSGQIIVEGDTHPGGPPQAFLLTPSPEPGSLSILAIGSLLLLARRR